MNYIRRLLSFYDIRPDGVINQAAHDEIFRHKRGHEVPSKYPSRWRIDLHVDDCAILEKNGERYGFRVLRIDPADADWTLKVLETARSLKDNQ